MSHRHTALASALVLLTACGSTATSPTSETSSTSPGEGAASQAGTQREGESCSPSARCAEGLACAPTVCSPAGGFRFDCKDERCVKACNKASECGGAECCLFRDTTDARGACTSKDVAVAYGATYVCR